jgi:hypothetical protein
MPRVSHRSVKVGRHKKWFRSRMRCLMYREALSDDDDSGEDDVDALVTALYLQAKRKRFHFRQDSYRRRCTSMFEHYLEMEESDFLLHFRLHKESFFKLLQYIESSDCFRRKSNLNGTFYKPQFPVKYQLLILLYVLGASGSDSNYRKVGSRFKISSGAVRLYVDRCTAAIISTLEHEVVYWPNDSERKFICDRIQDKYDFPNCVGFVDGTILPLEFKPSLYGEEYFCRKGCYGVHCLVICDDELRILDFLVGWPASVHDNRVWKNSDQMTESNRFFTPNQYLLADSAFGNTLICIPAFKRLRRTTKLPKDKEEFNTLLSRARVRIEHCIGLLKNRFTGLRNIRTIIKGTADMRRIIDRVRVCVVLHNMLIGSTFPAEWVVPNDEDLDDDGRGNNLDDEDAPVDNPNNEDDRREVIKNYMLHLT